MPTMFGVPVSGQPFMEAPVPVQPAKELIDRQALHKNMVESQIVNKGGIPLNEPGITNPKAPVTDEMEEAIRQREESVKLLELAKSPEDKDTATKLLEFWTNRINELQGGKVLEVKQEPPKIIQPPDLFTKINASAINRVKYPRNKRHKEMKKEQSKKVTWLI